MLINNYSNSKQLLRFSKGPSALRPRETKRCTAGEFWETINNAEIKDICERLKTEKDDSARKELKKRLPVFCFNASVFKDDYRKKENAVASGLGMLDIDGVEDPRALFDTFQSQVTELSIYLVHISAGGHGLHLVYGLQSGESVAEGNTRMAKAIGVEEKHDEGCKDLSRASYAFTFEYLLHLDWSGFILDYHTLEAQEAILKDMANGTVTKEEQTATEPKALETKALNETGKAKSLDEKVETQDSDEDSYDGVSLSIIWSRILSDFLKLKRDPVKGRRNNSLFKAALYMRCVTSYNYATLRKNVETWGLDENEVETTLKSALKADRSASDINRVEKLVRDIKTENEAKEKGSDDKYDERGLKKNLPKMPDVKFPRLFQLLFKHFPKELRNQVFFATCAYLNLLLTALRYKTNQGKDEVPVSLVIFVGPPASGKSFIDNLKDIILKPIAKDEETAQAMVEAWQRENAASGNGKKKMRPIFVNRLIEGDFTMAGIHSTNMNARGQNTLIVSEEFDAILHAISPVRGIESISDILRLAWDGAKAGQKRVGDMSINGFYHIMMNLVSGLTRDRQKALFKNVSDGLVTRIQFISMPIFYGKSNLPYSDLTQKESDEIDYICDELYKIGMKTKEEIDALEKRLNTAGEIVLQSERNYRNNVMVNMPKLDATIAVFEEELARESQNARSEALETFRRRIPSMMRRIGMVLYAVNGFHESDAICQICEWAGNYILQEMLNSFGYMYDKISNEFENSNNDYQRKGKNFDILELLPKKIRKEDFKRKRHDLGLTLDTSRKENEAIRTFFNRSEVEKKIIKIDDEWWENTLSLQDE